MSMAQVTNQLISIPLGGSSSDNQRPPDGDDDVNMSATVHQIVELCAWRGERAYRPHDHNNFNEEEIDALIEYLCTN